MSLRKVSFYDFLFQNKGILLPIFAIKDDNHEPFAAVSYRGNHSALGFVRVPGFNSVNVVISANKLVSSLNAVLFSLRSGKAVSC